VTRGAKDVERKIVDRKEERESAHLLLYRAQGRRGGRTELFTESGRKAIKINSIMSRRQRTTSAIP